MGKNGSGKTSLLESIYYLSMGRSFRTHRNKYIIQHQQKKCTLFAEVISPHAPPITMGLERALHGKCTMRLQQKETFSRAAMAKTLPIQLIDTDSHDILVSGPKFRRQFLDWGVFHVEPLFFDTWKRYQRALKQRNAALKNQMEVSHIVLWDEALHLAAEAMDQQRSRYFKTLTPIFFEIWKQFMPNIALQMEYQRGWSQDQSLYDVLQQHLSKDQYLGYTQLGAQKADLLFSINNIPAAQMLSQGQQKILVYALKLAQGALLSQHAKPCIYLIDDLAAELDKERRMEVLSLLNGMNAQIFLTGTSVEELGISPVSGAALAMFHVEQGAVQGR